MLETKLILDKNRRRVRKCPCGEHHNKDGKFVPFVGFDDAGFCHSCQKTFIPPNFNVDVEVWSAKNMKVEQGRSDNQAIDLKKLHIPDSWVAQSCSLITDPFSKYLIRLFGVDFAKSLKKEKGVGSLHTMPNVTVFWLRDSEQTVISCKMMNYALDGHRKGYNNYFHSHYFKERGLIPSEYQMNLPFFGAHCIHRDPCIPVAIVESEKTALVMGVLYPAFVWLSASGASGLTYEKMKILTDRNVILFPDLGQYDHWTEKAAFFKDVTSVQSIKVSRVLEDNVPKEHRKKGYDVLDYFLNVDPAFGCALGRHEYPLMWDF